MLCVRFYSSEANCLRGKRRGDGSILSKTIVLGWERGEEFVNVVA